MRGFDNPTERMKHTGQAIRDAAEKGGYGYRWWKANDIEHNEGYNALPMRSLTEHLNDPNSWKALEAIERDVAAVAREPNISRNISRNISWRNNSSRGKPRRVDAGRKPNSLIKKPRTVAERVIAGDGLFK